MKRKCGDLLNKMYISIKVKIIAIISIFFMVALFFNMLYSLDKSKEYLNSYLNNLNKSSTKILNKNIRADLYELNYSDIKNTIDSFDNEYFKNIYILTKTGYIFAQRNIDVLVLKKHKDFLNLLNEKQEFKYMKPVIVSNTIIGYILIENSNKIFTQIKEEKRYEIFRLFAILFLITILISYFISIIITEPIDKIIENIKKINENKDFEFEHKNDEYGYLSKIIEQNYKNIHKLNNDLKISVKTEINKNKQKDEILEEQSLRASMGGMMDAVAHQWMQPLSVIKMISQDLEIKSNFSQVTKEDIESASKNTFRQIEHLTNTLDEFRSFFRVDKRTEDVKFEDIINSTLLLLKDEITTNNIRVELKCEYKETVKIIPNEFKHILINIINNAKDAFESNKIRDRKINIDIFKKYDEIIINIKDNAGGIPQNLIDRVFDINVTSKKQSEGTGVGLYLSKMIIHKINGDIKVKNEDKGACFTLSLKA